jgi:hypothetical protein
MYRIELSVALAFLSNNNNTDTTPIKVTCGERADATDPTGTKVDGVRSALG